VGPGTPSVNVGLGTWYDDVGRGSLSNTVSCGTPWDVTPEHGT
jgi:hypothetical protein